MPNHASILVAQPNSSLKMLPAEPIYIGGFSGGIDSQAAARFMLNRYGAARVVLVNSDAGGNEHA